MPFFICAGQGDLQTHTLVQSPEHTFHSASQQSKLCQQDIKAEPSTVATADLVPEGLVEVCCLLAYLLLMLSACSRTWPDEGQMHL